MLFFSYTLLLPISSYNKSPNRKGLWDETLAAWMFHQCHFRKSWMFSSHQRLDSFESLFSTHRKIQFVLDETETALHHCKWWKPPKGKPHPCAELWSALPAELHLQKLLLFLPAGGTYKRVLAMTDYFLFWLIHSLLKASQSVIKTELQVTILWVALFSTQSPIELIYSQYS